MLGEVAVLSDLTHSQSKVLRTLGSGHYSLIWGGGWWSTLVLPRFADLVPTSAIVCLIFKIDSFRFLVHVHRKMGFKTFGSIILDLAVIPKALYGDH